MPEAYREIQVIGYGNPGRQDDGLGPACIARLQNRLPRALQSRINLRDDYQLNVEDALEVSSASNVIFVDASITATAPFAFSTLGATKSPTLGSHSLTPSQVIQLCRTLYDAQPAAYVMAIRGYAFDQFEEALSDRAEANLKTATDFLANWLETTLAAAPSQEVNDA